MKFKKILDSYVHPCERDLNDIRQKVSEHIEKLQQQNKIYYDGKHKLPTDYIEGDLVLINNYDEFQE